MSFICFYFLYAVGLLILLLIWEAINNCYSNFPQNHKKITELAPDYCRQITINLYRTLCKITLIYSKFGVFALITTLSNQETSVIVWDDCCIRYPWTTIGINQGRRNGFVMGGGGQKKPFFELHFHIERIRFCTLVNMWFTISTELKAHFILIAIHWFICRYF